MSGYGGHDYEVPLVGQYFLGDTVGKINVIALPDSFNILIAKGGVIHRDADTDR